MFSLTQEQFDNLDLVDKYLRGKQPNFLGFRGSKDKMVIVEKGYNVETKGIESLIVDELKTININALKNQDPQRLKKKKLRNKLKALGFDNEDLELLGLKTDIAD